jgi:threonine dehydrogenase-like Zn-dependent dehydrogenase
MLAAVTDGVESVALVERDGPARPGPGEVLLAPEAVGICGSDYHFFLGELSPEAGGDQFPRVLGHEIGARIVAVGKGCRVAVGQLTAVLPLLACGDCYPCSVGRPNTCDNFKLIGIHLDGGLQQQLIVPESQVFPIAVHSAEVAALVEPLSIGVQAVRRANVAPGERVVVFGAGPIGQCIALAARDREADVLVIDLEASRLALSRELGSGTLLWTTADEVIKAARDWSGPGGAPVVFDATGAATAVEAMLQVVASAGRAVQVGMSNQEVPVRIGLLTEKELDLLGVSCCDRDAFGEAVAIAERHEDELARLVSHRFGLDRFPEALRFAIDNPTEVLKVMILSESD